MSEKCLKVKTTAKLELTFENTEEAEIALKSLQPDNYPLPHGLELSMKVKGNRLEVYIECERNLLSLLNTLDDILSMVNLAFKSIKAISHWD